MQPVWLGSLEWKQFGESFEKKNIVEKVLQMQSVLLCYLLCASSEDSYKKIQWGKTTQMKQCNYASYVQSIMKIHLISHHGEKLNKCNQCDYASIQASNLRKHLWWFQYVFTACRGSKIYSQTFIREYFRLKDLSSTDNKRQKQAKQFVW